MLHTLPFGLGTQNEEKKNLLTCHGHLGLSSLFHKVSEKRCFLLSNFQLMYLAKIALWSEAKKIIYSVGQLMECRGGQR